jgi:hypothetical protein
MASVALTGNDTTILNTRIMTDFAEGDCVNFEVPNNLVEVKPGKNGNAIYALNAAGAQINVTMRLIAGSADDKYMNSEMNTYKNDPPSYTLIAAEFVKRVGDGSGNITNIIYQLSGGVIQKSVPTKENVNGDTEQAVSVYTLVFTNSKRVLS